MFFAACDKNNDDPDPSPQPTPNPSINGEWQVFINGESVDFTSMHSIYWNQEFGSLDYGELQIYFNYISGDGLMLDIRNYEPQNHPENEVITKVYDTDGVGINTECNIGADQNYYCDMAGVGYSEDGILLYGEYNHESTNPGFIEITECSGETLRVSGTFEFEVEEYMGADDNLIISGSFSNIPYVVFY